LPLPTLEIVEYRLFWWVVYLFITASFLRRGFFYRLVGFSRAKRASNQRVRGGADMVMNKIANGGPLSAPALDIAHDEHSTLGCGSHFQA
jgi:hypothetical protein